SDLTRPGAVAGADTWFKLGSLTKSVTALAAGLLVDEGRLAWDAPLAQALPELQAADPRVASFTLRQLLSHRTGLDLDRLEALLWPQP
ncbi:serine hydrolase, partial [Vibrio parahaemolyticus]